MWQPHYHRTRYLPTFPRWAVYCLPHTRCHSFFPQAYNLVTSTHPPAPTTPHPAAHHACPPPPLPFLPHPHHHTYLPFHTTLPHHHTACLPPATCCRLPYASPLLVGVTWPQPLPAAAVMLSCVRIFVYNATAVSMCSYAFRHYRICHTRLSCDRGNLHGWLQHQLTFI